MIARLFGPRVSPASDDGRREIRIGAAVLAAFFVLFLGWAAFIPLDAGVVAEGVVVVSGNRQVVQHRDGGVVDRLAVKEGQRVERGQVLLELSSPELVAQERALLTQIADLQMQRARLTAETSGASALTRPTEWSSWSEEDRALAEEAFRRHEREARGSGAWSEYDARIAGHRDEIASVMRQESLLGEELAGVRDLAEQGFAPMTRVRALERALAELEGRRAELRAAIATTQQERSERLRAVQAQLAELTPQFEALRVQLERVKVRAPSTGVVVGLAAHTPGGVIAPGARIMDIVPEGRDLSIEAQVRPEDADDLFPGQSAELRVTAFGRNLPVLHGEIRSVSADRFVDERSGRAYFIAQAVAPPSELERISDAAGARLRAGLPVQVIAATKKRTALQYLLEPLNQSLWRSFREQ